MLVEYFSHRRRKSAIRGGRKSQKKARCKLVKPYLKLQAWARRWSRSIQNPVYTTLWLSPFSCIV